MPEGGPQNNPPKQEGLNIKPFSTDFVKEEKAGNSNIETVKQTNTAVEKTLVSIHPKFKDFTLNLYKELINNRVFNMSFILGLDFIKTLELRKKEAETILANLIETKIIKKNGDYYEIIIPEKDFENHLSKYELITTEEIKNVEPPKKPTEKPEPEAETLPPGVFSAEYIKDIVFDLLEEEGKTPESYEIIKDEKGIQTFVLKFTDGTTNEHSVRGVLGLRLKIPIFDLEGIEPVDGGKNFRLVWKTGIENEVTERPKSEKEIELEKLLVRKEEIAKDKERIRSTRAALLKKLEEIERKKKK